MVSWCDESQKMVKVLEGKSTLIFVDSDPSACSVSLVTNLHTKNLVVYNFGRSNQHLRPIGGSWIMDTVSYMGILCS